MNIPVRTLTAALFLAIFGASSATTAQVISQPTPAPLVTADMEQWYLTGEPITYAGNTYYPAGAQVSFNSNEMVRSGSHFGVPLYVRSTDEPYSLVYVPLARGFMQPYMRPRTGDVMQTAGTTAPAGAAAAFSPLGGTVPPPQAAGPPTMVAGPPADAYGQPRAPIPAISSPTAPGTVATGGAVAAQPPPVGYASPQATPAAPTHTRIGPRPQGINAVFIEFRDRRWYGEGQPVPLDRSRMIEVGELRGFPVFADRDEPEKRIYISTTIGSTIVAPYSGR
jgi:hypothetical protein